MQQKLVQKQDKTINLFEQSIKSEYTRRVYVTCLKIYLQFPGSSKLIHSTDTRKIEDHITDFITSMKEQNKSFTGISNYVAAVCKYYRMKRVSLDTKHIREYLPEFRKLRKDKAYTYDQINRLLDIADERMQAIILLLSSSGIRIGSIPGLRLRNIEKLESEYGIIYKITVYEGFNEEYVTFCTPECATVIDNYLKMRERYGEKLTPNSYLIREQFDVRDPFKTSKCKDVKSNTITWKLIDLAERSLLRKREVLTGNKKRSEIRKDVPIAHGFRKFYSSQLVEADLKTEFRWLLEGHNLKGNDTAYIRTTEKRLQEEYEKAIDKLTIDPTKRQEREIKILKIEKSRIDDLEAKIQKLERKHGRIR